MSKPIAKKKKKRSAEIREVFDPKAQRKAEKKLRDFLMELDERSEERERYTSVILDVNDPSMLDIMDSIIESLKRMSKVPEIVSVDGQSFRLSGAELDLAKRIQERNFRYIAIRILVACAEWNIRIGDFKLPKHNCARCGKKVKSV